MKQSNGTRIVKCAVFVPEPLCAMTLARQGADLIGFDPIEDGLDVRRRVITGKMGNGIRWTWIGPQP